MILVKEIPVRLPQKMKLLVSSVMGINSMLETLQSVIGDISDESVNLDQAIANVTESVGNANVNSSDVSEVAGTTAASMEKWQQLFQAHEDEKSKQLEQTFQHLPRRAIQS